MSIGDPCVYCRSRPCRCTSTPARFYRTPIGVTVTTGTPRPPLERIADALERIATALEASHD